MKIRTRYAPSPTGFFHIGGARTALFNYLFAKHNNGDFVLRIEDTDIDRNVQGGIDSQIDNLNWLKLTPDESIKNPGQYGPYIQTEKLQRYQSLAKKLIDEGKAYYCFCSEDELKQAREEALKNGQTPKYNRKCLNLSKEEIDNKLNKNVPAVIRLKMKDVVDIKWNDLIRGNMSVPTSALTDPVILKSNGIPMYNFAVVIDDYDMKITHVLRGEEHLSNTPYQIAIKEALGFQSQSIEYGHLSIIVDETGKKLSKRNKTLKQFIEDYKTMGFLPEAIDNFMCLLGWTNPNNKEIMNMQEMIKDFDLKRMSKAPAFFDFKKMLWIGGEYFKQMTDKDYLSFVKKFYKQQNLVSSDKLDNALLIFKSQIGYAEQINQMMVDTFSFKQEELLKIPQEVSKDVFKQCITSLKEVLLSLKEIILDNGNEIVNKVKDLTKFKAKDLYMPIRWMCIAKSHGPEMNKILYIIGKEQILKNIELCLGNI